MNKEPKILPRPVIETRKLAKLCEQHGYDYLLIAYPRPGRGQKSMEAEVGYHLETPANLGSLLATLWRQHPDIAQAITAAMNFRAYAAIEEQKAEGKEEAKIIGLG
jgi:hypothetical protein